MFKTLINPVLCLERDITSASESGGRASSASPIITGVIIAIIGVLIGVAVGVSGLIAAVVMYRRMR